MVNNRRLTEQQKYLLNRIPNRYDLNKGEELPEPKEVTRARGIVDRFEKTKARRACEQQKRNEALLRKAKEAVYFATPEKALQIIQQCEKLLKRCGE